MYAPECVFFVMNRDTICCLFLMFSFKSFFYFFQTEEGRQVHGVDLTEGAKATSTLRFADGQKLVHKRKCMDLELILPGSPGGSYKKKRNCRDS